MTPEITKKVKQGERLSKEDALRLLGCNDLNYLSQLSDYRRRLMNGDCVYFNQNFHIEPSNVCVHRCKFCSFRRNHKEESGAWEWSIEEVCQYAMQKYHPGVTEVHITGSVHPKRDLFFYAAMIQALHDVLPAHVTIKAFSAIEIDYMCQRSGKSHKEGLSILKEHGLHALPGGGAEIFDPILRNQICPDKTNAQTWLSIHETAHRLGIPSNATMLFGHIETTALQVDHLDRIRNLQDKSGGFAAFIPLKYRSANNELSSIGEADIVQTLRLFAVTRLFLDNITHIKVYWPMLGKEATQMALLFGADDLDGTIQQSTKIYSMAGAEELHPALTKEELSTLIKRAGYRPTERDSFYRNC